MLDFLLEFTVKKKKCQIKVAILQALKKYPDFI